MIITKSWLEEWVELGNLSFDDICSGIESVGFEIGKKVDYKIPNGVVIGYVERVTPYLKNLNICIVRVGRDSLQIVCGAKNIKEEQYVAVALVGTILDNTTTINHISIKGIDSFGMICSAKEIMPVDMGDNILVLDDSIGKLELGKELKEYKKLNDVAIDIELTANRGDCFSIRGIGKEIASHFRVPIREVNLKNEIVKIRNSNDIKFLESKNTYHHYLLAYQALFSKTAIKSNTLIDFRLAINNIVNKRCLDNIWEYVRISTGVIISAYKLDAFKKCCSKEVLVNIKEDKNGLVCIFDNKTQILSQVGINQTEDSKVLEDTKEIILEASYVDPHAISKSVYDCKLDVDSRFYRSSRGSEPDVEIAIKYFLSIFPNKFCLIERGSYLSKPTFKKNNAISVYISRLNAIIGSDISKSDIIDILRRLYFAIKEDVDDVDIIYIIPPNFRTDIKGEQDIAEEILRIVGMDNIKAKPLAMLEKNRNTKSYLKYKREVLFRTRSVHNGFFEAINYIFVKRDNLTKYSLETIIESRDILNPINKDMDTLRTTLILGLIANASSNIKIGKKSIRFFEIGKIFSKERREKFAIAFLFTGDLYSRSAILRGAVPKVDFFIFSQKILNIVGEFEIIPHVFKHKILNPYESGAIYIDGAKSGFIGRLNKDIEEEYSILNTYVCEIDFNALVEPKREFKSFSKLLPVYRDLSIVVKKDVDYLEIKKFIKEITYKDISLFYLIDMYSNDKMRRDISLTIRFIIKQDAKSLQDSDINFIMQTISEKLYKKFRIRLR